jgi:hypothetical protein
MFVAQSLGEYGALGSGSAIVARFEWAAQSLQSSVREHPAGWAAAAVCVVFVLWLFRRR